MRIGTGKEELRKRPCQDCARVLKYRIAEGTFDSTRVNYLVCCGTWTVRDGKVVRPD